MSTENHQATQPLQASVEPRRPSLSPLTQAPPADSSYSSSTSPGQAYEAGNNPNSIEPQDASLSNLAAQGETDPLDAAAREVSGGDEPVTIIPQDASLSNLAPQGETDPLDAREVSSGDRGLPGASPSQLQAEASYTEVTAQVPIGEAVSSPIAPDVCAFEAGDEAICTKTGETVTVLVVHFDDAPNTYFTIRMAQGSERQTSAEGLIKPSEAHHASQANEDASMAPVLDCTDLSASYTEGVSGEGDPAEASGDADAMAAAHTASGHADANQASTATTVEQHREKARGVSQQLHNHQEKIEQARRQTRQQWESDYTDERTRAQQRKQDAETDFNSQRQSRVRAAQTLDAKIGAWQEEPNAQNPSINELMHKANDGKVAQVVDIEGPMNEHLDKVLERDFKHSPKLEEAEKDRNKAKTSVSEHEIAKRDLTNEESNLKQSIEELDQKRTSAQQEHKEYISSEKDVRQKMNKNGIKCKVQCCRSIIPALWLESNM